MTQRLILGTAQIGMAYGIANRTGQPSAHKAREIVKTAWEEGITKFDTAQEYGESERLLGESLDVLGVANEAKITTKLSPTIDLLDKAKVRQAVKKSLHKLKVSQIFCLMLHREQQLDLLDKGLASCLRDLKDAGLIKNIGISVYSPTIALRAIQSETINILQVPTNILDQRFEKAGVFQAAREKGKTIHIRSVFLQGLILMEARDLPQYMAFAAPLIQKLEALGVKYEMTRTAMALSYIKLRYPECDVIFGAESPAQVRENCRIWNSFAPGHFVKDALGMFSDVEERILNPTLWD